jgi:hypothetical protein
MLGYVLLALKVEIFEMFLPISVNWVQYTFVDAQRPGVGITLFLSCPSFHQPFLLSRSYSSAFCVSGFQPKMF